MAETEGVTGFPEMIAAENYVIDNHLADVITQSFGATEQTFENVDDLMSLRSAFMNAAANGVTVLASSGDDGVDQRDARRQLLLPVPDVVWPASDPLVTAVGGTQLFLNQAGTRLKGDTAWSDAFGAAGGGVSAVFPRPDYQSGISPSGTGRALPDISMSAAVNGGIVVYYSFVNAGFHIFGGTSEASPLFSGIVALAAQRAGHGLGQINPALYALQGSPSSGIVDVVHRNITSGFLDSSGNVVVVHGWRAKKGYDLASGLGTVDAAQFVPALANAAGRPDPGPWVEGRRPWRPSTVCGSPAPPQRLGGRPGADLHQAPRRDPGQHLARRRRRADEEHQVLAAAELEARQRVHLEGDRPVGAGRAVRHRRRRASTARRGCSPSPRERRSRGCP